MGMLVRSLAIGRKSTEIFKTLKKVQVWLNPFDESAATAREFLRRVRTRPVRNANPKLEVSVDIVEDFGNPRMTLSYLDGQEQNLKTSGHTIVELLNEVERMARWKGDTVNPFEKLRAERVKALGLD